MNFADHDTSGTNDPPRARCTTCGRRMTQGELHSPCGAEAMWAVEMKIIDSRPSWAHNRADKRARARKRLPTAPPWSAASKFGGKRHSDYGPPPRRGRW